MKRKVLFTVIVFVILILPISLYGQWNIETVDTTGTVGVKCAIVVDTNNYPHISYRDGTVGWRLKYANWDGSLWQTTFVDTTESVYGVTSIALDDAENPHISFYKDGALWHAWWNGSDWQQEMVDALIWVDIGKWSSIAFDTDGYPHIAYTYYTGDCYLKHAYKNASGWHTQIADSLIGDEFQFVSLALDNFNLPNISYYDWHTYDLKYAWLEPGTVDTLWTKTYGGSSYDYGSSVQQTTDGGYIIGGKTYSYGPNTPNYGNAYLIKTDSLGNTIWTGNYNGGSNQDICYSVQQTTDGGYILVGYSWGYLYGYDDVFLVKTDSLGNMLWQKAYGGSINDEGKSVQLTTDGGYVITGRANGPVWTEGGDVYLIKTDSMGNALWTKTYGGDSTDEGNSVQQTADGGYIIAGYTKSYGAGSHDFYLLKTDSIGDTIWTKTYGGDTSDVAQSVKQTIDGGYIITGYTKSFGAGESNVYLLKTDSLGDTLWTKVYDYYYSSGGSDIQITKDSGYIITGSCRKTAGDSTNVYLIKTDVSGDTIWTKTYGDNNITWSNSVQQTTDGGYIAAGGMRTYGDPNLDIYLLKLSTCESTWYVERVDTTGHVGTNSSITIDSLNKPHIAYWDGSNFNVKYAQWNETNWQIDVVDTPEFVYNPSISMVLNEQDNPCIAYVADWNVLKYAHWDGFYWYTEAVDTNAWSEWVSLAMDKNGCSHIAYYEGGDSTNLKYAKGIPSGIEERITVNPSPIYFLTYPNIFKKEINIQYTVSSSEKVCLRVYNITGQLVKVIVDKTQKQGKYTICWNGTNCKEKKLKNGVYFLYLQRGNLKNIKKVILLK